MIYFVRCNRQQYLMGTQGNISEKRHIHTSYIEAPHFQSKHDTPKELEINLLA